MTEFLLRVLANVIGMLPLAAFGLYLLGRINRLQAALRLGAQAHDGLSRMTFDELAEFDWSNLPTVTVERWRREPEPEPVIFRDPPSSSTTTERNTIDPT